jgi:hypothetical protein
MGTMGLALPWETRISSVPREREMRVEPSEDLPGRPSDSVVPAATAAPSEDTELAERCRTGDMGGYERLYALHGARMKNVARNLLGNPIDAEDAVQETFLKVQRSIAGFRGQSSFVTTRRFFAVRSRRLPSCGNRRDARDYGDGFEEHTFSGEAKPSPGT